MLILTKSDDEVTFNANFQGPKFYQYMSLIKQLASRRWMPKEKLWRIGIHDYDILLSDCKGEGLNEIITTPELLPLIEKFHNFQKYFIELAEKLDTDYPMDLDFLNGELMPHQKVAVEFLMKRQRCLNASEMGTGKTLPAIVATEILKRRGRVKNCLVICPSSVKYNWSAEIEKFIEDPDVQVITGTPLERLSGYESNAFYTVVNFEALRSDFKTYLYDKVYDCVIVDEIHRIRNTKTQQSKAVKHFGKTAKYKFGLTGTPIQNKLVDLFSVMDFINPHLLGNQWHFTERHCAKGYFGQVIGYERLDEISQKLKPIMIRRMKREVLKDLPEKIREDRMLPFGKAQKKIYKQIVEEIHLDEDGFVVRGQQLAKLLRIRRLCVLPILEDPKIKESPKVDELESILVDLIGNGHKVVVFSQWTGVLNHLEIKFSKYPSLKITGDVEIHGGLRQKICEEFKDSKEKNLMFLSTAGGEGINLQCADYIIFMDLPYNPSTIIQVEDRLHRKGQENSVTVIRILIEDSVEEIVLKVLKEKMELSKDVIDEKQEVEKIVIDDKWLMARLKDWRG